MLVVRSLLLSFLRAFVVLLSRHHSRFSASSPQVSIYGSLSEWERRGHTKDSLDHQELTLDSSQSPVATLSSQPLAERISQYLAQKTKLDGFSSDGYGIVFDCIYHNYRIRVEFDRTNS